MPRGGRRNGKPGASYPNRSDLSAQPVRTAPSAQYGEGVVQQRAQQAMPLPQATPTTPAPGQAAASPPPDPGMLTAPTSRPGEPVTAGLPMGAGPGPEAIAQGDTAIDDLRRVYAATGFDEVRQIIERYEQERGLF